MDNDLPADAASDVENESAENRSNRISREAVLIAKAHGDLDAGLGIDDDDLEDWLDALETNEDAPAPLPKAQHS